MRKKSTRPRRALTGSNRPPRWTRIFVACRRSRGAWCEMDGARVKILAARVVNGDVAPGTVLDDAPSIACGAGALQAAGAARRQGSNGWRGFHARCSGDAGAGFGVMRYRLTIEYDGAGFCGWQAQADGDAVQDALSDAVEKFCGARVTRLWGRASIPAFTRAGRSPILTLNRKCAPINCAMR